MSIGMQHAPNTDPLLRTNSGGAPDEATNGATGRPVETGLPVSAYGSDSVVTAGSVPIDASPTPAITAVSNPDQEPVSVFGRWALNIENAATAGHESETRVSAWFKRGRERIAGAKDRFKERFDPLRRTARESATLGKTILKYSPVLAVGAASIAVEKSVGGVSDVGRAISRGAKAAVGFVTGSASTVSDRFSSRTDELCARGLQLRANGSVLREAASHTLADRTQRSLDDLEQKTKSSIASAMSAEARAKESLSFDVRSGDEQEDRKISLFRGIGQLVTARYFRGRANRQASRLEKKRARSLRRDEAAESRSEHTNELIRRLTDRVDRAHDTRRDNPGIRREVTHGIRGEARGVVKVLDRAASVYDRGGRRGGAADAIHTLLQAGGWREPGSLVSLRDSIDTSSPQD